MPTKQILTVHIDRNGRQQLIARDQKVVIVKSFGDNSDYPVACITFVPFGDDDKVEFNLGYYLYATGCPPKRGNSIKIQTQTMAKGGALYAFDGCQFLRISEGDSMEYNVNNKARCDVTFGLGQNIVINDNANGVMPLNCEVGYRNSVTTFRPVEELLVFVARGVGDSQVMDPLVIQPFNNAKRCFAVRAEPPIIGNYLKVDFGSATSQTIYYDNDTNVFVDTMGE